MTDAALWVAQAMMLTVMVAGLLILWAGLMWAALFAWQQTRAYFNRPGFRE